MSHEIEIKFRVPASARQALKAELAADGARVHRTTLMARYFDTPDRRLARSGLAWRVRREGRRWVQALKAGGEGGLQRFEHEVALAQGQPDATLHAGTAPGRQLLRILDEAQSDGHAVGERFRVEVRRTHRLLRTRTAQVELAFDEGWIVAGERRLRVCELEFEHRAGSVAAMLALAGRWCSRLGLWVDPTSKAQRGDRLAEGQMGPTPRRAERTDYPAQANAWQAFGVVVDACLDQILHNASGLCEGDAQHRAEHVHQLRVGMRRLRSALRSFRGWVDAPPQRAMTGLKRVFTQLGHARDADVLQGPIAHAMLADGVPLGPAPLLPGSVDAAACLRGNDAQQVLLEWLRWRADWPSSPALSTPESPADTPDAAAPVPLAQRAQRRFGRWHRSLRADAANFDAMTETEVHALRKRVKRQRYALEFFAPLLDPAQTAAYLEVLAQLQDRLGTLNDLFVARERFQSQPQVETSAWLALGWLAPRLVESRAQVKPALQRLARCKPPSARAGKR